MSSHRTARRAKATAVAVSVRRIAPSGRTSSDFTKRSGEPGPAPRPAAPPTPRRSRPHRLRHRRCRASMRNRCRSRHHPRALRRRKSLLCPRPEFRNLIVHPTSRPENRPPKSPARRPRRSPCRRSGRPSLHRSLPKTRTCSMRRPCGCRERPCSPRSRSAPRGNGRPQSRLAKRCSSLATRKKSSRWIARPDVRLPGPEHRPIRCGQGPPAA